MAVRMPERIVRAGRFLSQRSVLAIWLALLSAVTVGVVWHQNDQFNDYVRCEAELVEDLVHAVGARQDADAYDRASDRLETQAIVALIEGLLAADSEAETDAAVEEYQGTLAKAADRRAEATAQRAANPVPDLPSTVCGAPPNEHGGS